MPVRAGNGTGAGDRPSPDAPVAVDGQRGMVAETLFLEGQATVVAGNIGPDPEKPFGSWRYVDRPCKI